MDGQDSWCAGASAVVAAGDDRNGKIRYVREVGEFPMELELESTVGMLRGRVSMHNHCYLPEDFEAMLRVSDEFGFRIRAFHHAIEAWQVPEMIKELGE